MCICIYVYIPMYVLYLIVNKRLGRAWAAWVSMLTHRPCSATRIRLSTCLPPPTPPRAASCESKSERELHTHRWNNSKYLME